MGYKPKMAREANAYGRMSSDEAYGRVSHKRANNSYQYAYNDMPMTDDENTEYMEHDELSDNECPPDFLLEDKN